MGWGQGEPMRLRSSAVSNEGPGSQQKQVGEEFRRKNNNIYTLSINIAKYFFPSSSCYNSSPTWLSVFAFGDSEKERNYDDY